MSYAYDLHPAINLHVAGRISKTDARRQTATARVILQRLESRPGLILADEVGMGKTFVALAVAASVALQPRERRPVVVMVPPSLKEKWPKDFELFLERCIDTPNVRSHLIAKSAANAIQFLKLLDDPPSNQASIIFLTHGAMSPHRKLKDGWVKLAIIQKALHQRQYSKRIRQAICTYMGRLLQMRHVTKRSPDVWMELLTTDPRLWFDILDRHQLRPADNDDPVPEAILRTIEQMPLTDFYQTLRDKIPYRRSASFENRIQAARGEINNKILELWDRCIHSLKIKLPLLILDEAHHLKNPQTQLASLFQDQRAAEDAAELSKGPLAEVFERMLFLTATPFQLGHYELCSVLERFAGISWKGVRSPSMGKNAFLSDLTRIQKLLDAAQVAAVSLDQLWGKLTLDDLIIADKPADSVEEWWGYVKTDAVLTATGEQIRRRYRTAKKRMKEAEEALQPYAVRHARPKDLPDIQKPRRVRFSGKAIADNHLADFYPGLDIDGDALLPFLLAARVTALKPESRPVFAEGLASSFEAFIHTREQRLNRKNEQKANPAHDGDDSDCEIPEEDKVAAWYLDRLECAIQDCASLKAESHPKISATISKAVELWKSGEKVLIFCHYIATGETVSKKVDEALDAVINSIAADKLGCSKSEAANELEKIGNRFFAQDSPIRRATNRAVNKILQGYEGLEEQRERILRIVRRYTRTPSFLVRFFPLGSGNFDENTVYQALSQTDGSGMILENLLKDFFDFLVKHCGKDERDRYLDALEHVQPGSKVRLANGATKQEMRQRLMLTFNTPFYPEVLVASMIMAEGVDLHLNCRHVIHHDLCWNPSTLEQRTGRIDRIGAKVERCGQPIQVYLPYIAKTQDEKMYRVVMDRERWFKVVMGENYKVDAQTTEKLADRIPFPEEAAEGLSFDLSVVGK